MLSIQQLMTSKFGGAHAALPHRVHKRLQKAIKTLKDDPTNAHREPDIKEVEQIDACRLKVVDFHTTYKVGRQGQSFISVLPHKDVYRKLGKLVADIELVPIQRPIRGMRCTYALTASWLTS